MIDTDKSRDSELSAAELSRYSRHILLPQLGIEGQKKLKSSRVALVGAGGLGSPLGLYLAAAGVGHITIIDDDCVEESNLQRQVIYTVEDLGKAKAECAAARLRRLNPEIDIAAVTDKLTADNALALFKNCDLVVDGSDNFATRYLVNDSCVLLGIPDVYGSIFRFEGQATVFNHAGGPCYRCLFPEPPPPDTVPSCSEAGVLGVLPGLIASVQATEALKILAGIGESLSGRLLLYDALTMRFRELRAGRNPECPICGDNPAITELADYGLSCEFSATRQMTDIEPAELKKRLEAGTGLVLIDVREPYEREICAIAGSIAVPLADLQSRLDDYQPGDTLVFYCKSGGRSASACELARRAGFTRVYNLAGGILRWADAIEPEMRRY